MGVGLSWVVSNLTFFLWVLNWACREWFIWVSGLPSTYYGIGRVNPEEGGVWGRQGGRLLNPWVCVVMASDFSHHLRYVGV